MPLEEHWPLLERASLRSGAEFVMASEGGAIAVDVTRGVGTQESVRRYIAAVQEYNTFVRSFPQNLTAKMFGYKTKANFSVENEKSISTAPTVDFNKPAPQPAPAQPPAH